MVYKYLTGIGMEMMQIQLPPPGALLHPSTHPHLKLDGGDIADFLWTSTADI